MGRARAKQTRIGRDGKLRVVLKEFPVLGPGSVEAAKVAIAVRMQDSGKKYFDFHLKLLGGRTKEKIPCYYSKLYRTDLKEMQSEAQKFLAQGFRAFKMRFGYGPVHGQQGVVAHALRGETDASHA